MGRSKSALIWILTTLATIATVGGAGWGLHRAGLLGEASRPAGATVAADGHYVVLLTQIEVEPATPSGGRWDMSDAGPDVRYDVYWRGSRVFRSSVRDDTLLARWDPEELGIKDILEGVSSESSLKAARITAQRGEKIEFRVFDDDPVMDDEIGRWEVAVDTLRTGDQTWNAPAPLIRQAICRVARVDSTGR